MQVKEYWWEGDDLILITVNDEKYTLHNAYYTSIRFDGLDYDSTENCTIELTKRYNHE